MQMIRLLRGSLKAHHKHDSKMETSRCSVSHAEAKNCDGKSAAVVWSQMTSSVHGSPRERVTICCHVESRDSLMRMLKTAGVVGSAIMPLHHVDSWESSPPPNVQNLNPGSCTRHQHQRLDEVEHFNRLVYSSFFLKPSFWRNRGNTRLSTSTAFSSVSLCSG